MSRSKYGAAANHQMRVRHRVKSYEQLSPNGNPGVMDSRQSLSALDDQEMDDIIAGDREKHDTDKNKMEHKEDAIHIPEPELIATVPQSEQSAFNCVDYKMDSNSNYNLVFGDLQKWRVHQLSEDEKNTESQDLWFLRYPKNRKQRRKVFVEGKVHRVWNICADEETFEAKLHLFLSWLVTKDEYLLCMEEEKRCVLDDDDAPNSKDKLESKLWHPVIHIPNLINGQQEYVDNVHGMRFKIVSYKKFAGFGNGPDMSTLTQNLIEAEKHHFDIKNAQFIRCKVEVSGSFHADFKLKTFPFDIQNLGLTIMDRTGRGSFLPALRQRKQFMGVDSQCFEVKEWDLEATMFEFVDADPNHDTQSFGRSLSQFIISFKYKRNYTFYLMKYVLFFASVTALSLLAFSFDFKSAPDRCGFIVGLVLTLA
eukprot:94130_1